MPSRHITLLHNWHKPMLIVISIFHQALDQNEAALGHHQRQCHAIWGLDNNYDLFFPEIWSRQYPIYPKTGPSWSLTKSI